MAVANPETHRSWGEYKQEIEENRRRRLRWMQRVMYYTKQEELGKNEETQRESGDDEEEDDNVSDGEVVQDSREEQRKFMENHTKGDDFEECLGATMGEMVGNWQEIELERRRHQLDNTERLGQGNQDFDFERRMHEFDYIERLDQENQDTDFERQMHELNNMERLGQETQDTDFERQVPQIDNMERPRQENQDFERRIHEFDNMERFCLENREASARDEHDFEQQYASVSMQLDHLRPHLEACESLEDNEAEQNNNEAQRFDNNNEIGDNLEHLALNLAMGGEEIGERVRNYDHNVENFLSEVDLKERESPEEEDLTKTEGQAENCEQFGHDSGFESHNSASSDSENGELYTEASYNNNMTESKDLEFNRFEDLPENGWEKAPIEEEEVEEVTKKMKDEHLEEDEATTTDEDDDILADADTDWYDLDEIKIYADEHHVTKLYQTLNDFKDAQILTDLELKTSDGRSARVHAIVLSGVSYLARRFLGRRHSWDKKSPLLKVDEEVEYESLEAVIEFAYTGAIRDLNATNAYEIKAAARYLGAPKVMEVCDRELAKSKGRPERKSLSAASELRICLQKIRELWTLEMGCDITLDVLSASFEVHKVILAACSDYFRAMFTSGMKESSQSSVYLQFLSAPELEALLECSYSGTVPLSWNCVFEITSTALQLQHQPVLDLCLKFLQKEINPHSCLDVVSFAEAFGMIKLLEFAEDYILRQFQRVSRSPKFKDLPARNLFKYLGSFALCVPSELVVFRAVVDWIQAKPKRRLKLAKELMKTIHFPLMTFKEFKEVQALKMWSNHSLQELYEAIFEDFCSNETETQNKCRIYLPKESLVLIGGDQISEDLGTRSISKELWFGNSLRNHTGIKKAMEWRRLGEMPQPGRFSHEVAVLNGHLYVVGGKKYYGTGDTLNSVFRYNPLENSWEELAAMHQARCCFSLVVFQSKLYAIGGQCNPNYTETVERYCPTANSWSFTCPLDLPLGGYVARVLAGEIFVSGGLNNDYDCLSSMFSYEPEKGCTYLENMIQPRALHCMEVLGDCLYVAGGLSQADSAGIVDMLACEMYNPLADSWTSFPPLPVPHVGSGSVVLEGKFYVLGGYSQEDYSDVKMVHRYDPATQQWENMGKMPGPNNDLRACVLCLPEHLRICPD